ncbi:MAG: dipeptidase [Lysobacteraceae bacterium]
MDKGRRRFMTGTGAMAACMAVGCRLPGAAGQPPHAPRIDALVSPLHAGRVPGAPMSAAELADLRASGLSAVHLSTGPVDREEGAYEATRQSLARWRGEAARWPAQLLFATAAGDIARAHASGRTAIIAGVQDTVALADEPGRLDTLREDGLRVVQLTYNQRNRVGDGCLVPEDRGLSGFGRVVLAGIESRRMLVDLAHSSRLTCLQALAATTRPAVISHTGCAALAANPRNKTDAELRALADGGGVAGIYLMPFLRESGQPMASDLLDHIDHALAVCGEDHVGIGSDGIIGAVEADSRYRAWFAEQIRLRRAAGISAPGEREDVFIFIPDLNGPDRYQRIAEGMAARGHGGRVVDKVLGLNMQRVMDAAWS